MSNNDMTNRKATAGSVKEGQNGAAHPAWKGGISIYRTSQKEYLRKLRMEAIEALGTVCVKCGFSDIRALQIDHVNGDGSKERKARKYKGNFHAHVLKSFLAGENKYQLLCANCNWIKRVENNERNK